MKRSNKVHRNFKICPKLDKTLRQLSLKTNINQTRIVELALANYFAVKR
jgi:Ribbon-helix-helix domain